MPQARAIFHTEPREFTDEQIKELDSLGLLANGDNEPAPLPPGGFGLGMVTAVPPVPVKTVAAEEAQKESEPATPASTPNRSRARTGEGDNA